MTYTEGDDSSLNRLNDMDSSDSIDQGEINPANLTMGIIVLTAALLLGALALRILFFS
jgi:hypothetical protein